MELINKGIILQPLNWLTIGLMVTIFVLFAHLGLTYFDQLSTKSEG